MTGMIRETLYKTFIYVATALASVSLYSCVSQEDNPYDDRPETDRPIRVIARQADALMTRADENPADVTWVRNGEFYFSYPKAINNEYNVASVNFDVLANGIGVITVPPASELKWLSVGGGSTPTFYLDNVSPALNTNASDSIQVVFDAENNPYVAAVFEGDRGRNDLLWGAKQETRNTGTINFDLHHYMSRVRVEITVDNTNGRDETKIDLSDATVELTSINQTPLSFNRLDGSLELDTNPANKEQNYTPLKLYSPDEASLAWEAVREDDDNPEIHTYVSKDFVLPPQDLLENADRPRLKITLSNGDVYSGIIPNAMLIQGNGTGLDYPVVLSFLKEYILTIRTVITQDPPSLSFMPVYVVQWVDKGTYDLEAHQAGIYTPEEFYKLIEYYNSGNAYQLERYGTLDTPEEGGAEQWNFVFFHSVSLDFDEIKGSMIPGTNGMANFQFSFTNYQISVYPSGNPEEAVSVTPEQLKAIVSNRNASFPTN